MMSSTVRNNALIGFAFLRIIFVVILWGASAYNFKYFTDISPWGILFASLYFLFSVFLIIGFKTSYSFLVLAFILLASPLRFESDLLRFSLALSAALLSPLPCSKYYSLDHWLTLTPKPGLFPKVESDKHVKPSMFFIMVFLVLATFMIAGPSYRQLLGGDSEIFRRWVMYSKIGLGHVAVQLYRREGAELIPIDYLNFLGYEHGNTPWLQRHDLELKKIWFIPGRGKLEYLITKLCDANAGQLDLRLEAKQAIRPQGWRWLHQADQPLCY